MMGLNLNFLNFSLLIFLFPFYIIIKTKSLNFIVYDVDIKIYVFGLY